VLGQPLGESLPQGGFIFDEQQMFSRVSHLRRCVKSLTSRGWAVNFRRGLQS
jgi:hypothetical protein